jgi:hypothetical protein
VVSEVRSCVKEVLNTVNLGLNFEEVIVIPDFTINNDTLRIVQRLVFALNTFESDLDVFGPFVNSSVFVVSIYSQTSLSVAMAFFVSIQVELSLIRKVTIPYKTITCTRTRLEN